MKQKVKRKDLLYPNLSYKVVGVLFEVYKELGSGYKEKYYQRAVSKELRNKKIKFEEQISIPLEYKGDKIGKAVADFLIEDKIVLEIKRKGIFSYRNIDQVVSYLKAFNLKLGILANFTSEGVKYKRILNE